jgi:C4-type Zn-finger protein
MDEAKAESKRKQKTQKCLVCKQEKSIRAFRQRPSNFGGIIIYKHCKSCVRKQIEAQIEKNKQKHRTVDFKNKPSQRKNWADHVYNSLHLTEADY